MTAAKARVPLKGVPMTVSVEQAQKALPQLIDQLLSGQEILLTRNDKPVAQLVAVTTASPAPVFGACRGLLSVLSEDEEHLKDFHDYMP
jgi:antitoxin (DNA-binding transcriptional repressor) of toxin-antitoxin stability system